MGCKVSKEFKEWFKVIEIADLLGLSKVSVYNKIKTLNSDTLQSLQKKEKGITYYNFKIIDMLRSESGSQDNKSESDNPDQDEASADIDDNNYKELYISHLEKEIEYLRQQQNEQLQEKDNQIKDLNNRLEEAHELTKNMQVLQLKQQPQDLLQLEEHFKEFDGKLCSIKEEMEKRRQQEQDKGLFTRIFKK